MLKLLILILLLSFDVYSTEEGEALELENVVVVGKVPGPDLWKISNGESTLWILGTLSPLPKRMEWNSKPIEEIIKDSQAMLLLPQVTTDLGFFQKLSLATTAIGMTKNPNKKKLQDIVPADVYQRWLSLKSKYMPRNKKVEKYRPIVASQQLYDKAIRKSGLEEKSRVSKKVIKLSKKHNLKLIQPQLVMELVEPKKALKKFKKSELDDIDCFTKTIERLEVDLDSMITRANAWAYGDIDLIIASDHPDNNTACMKTILESQVFQDLGMNGLSLEFRDVWLKAALKSMKMNKSTVALMPISELIKEGSVLEEFQNLGLTVKPPKSLTE